MASVPYVVQRSMFIEECIRIAGNEKDIYNTLGKHCGSINTKTASSRDFMVLLGDYCIETTAEIRTSGHYIYHPRSPDELQIVVEILLERYKSKVLEGVVNFYVPLCVYSSSGMNGHWSLLKLEINNGLIQNIEHYDSAGEKPEVKYYYNKRECLEGLRLYFKDYNPSLFAENCYAKQVLYAEQRGEDNFSCLDRMIINLLRIRAWNIAAPVSYNLCYSAYSGTEGATKLRAITAQLMQDCINRNIGCTLINLQQSSLRSYIDSSFVHHGLPLIGGISRDRVLQTGSYQPLLGSRSSETAGSQSVLQSRLGPSRVLQTRLYQPSHGSGSIKTAEFQSVSQTRVGPC